MKDVAMGRWRLTASRFRLNAKQLKRPKLKKLNNPPALRQPNHQNPRAKHPRRHRPAVKLNRRRLTLQRLPRFLQLQLRKLRPSWLLHRPSPSKRRLLPKPRQLLPKLSQRQLLKMMPTHVPTSPRPAFRAFLF